MKKNCSICKESKDLNYFFKDKNKSDGFYTICKSCKYNRKKSQIKSYLKTDKKELKCSKCYIFKSTYEFHKDKLHSTGFSSKCKECRKIDTQKDYQKNSELKKQKCLEYYHNNKSKVLKSQLERQKIREKEDIQYKLTRRLRNRLYYALKNKNWKKNTKFSEYIGCSYQELIQHLESKFIQNMSWENYGKWHIDHIFPLVLAESEQELYKLCHYTNLQPMWAIDNIKKSDNVK